MSGLDELVGPTSFDLREVEVDAELLAAELALLDAEVAFFAQPETASAGAFLAALLDVIDLRDFAGRALEPIGSSERVRHCRLVPNGVAR